MNKDKIKYKPNTFKRNDPSRRFIYLEDYNTSIYSNNNKQQPS